MSMKLLMTVLHRDQVRQQHAFEGCSVMVGRTPPCSVLLNDPDVSRVHAEISLEGGSYYLNDLGSANGTALNGIQQVRAELHSGDVITIGSFQLHVTVSPSAAPQNSRSIASEATDRTIRAPGAKRT
jgi:pSer/pThr/pTyr-binding forkhead associated (FHA) protein